MSVRGVRLLVDARTVGGSGIGRYVEAVLDRVIADHRFAEVRLLGEPDRLRGYANEGRGRVRITGFPTGLYRPAFQAAWLRARLAGATLADVHFFPHYDAPLALPRRSVVVIHDLIHFKVPDAFPAWQTMAASALLATVVRRAHHVLVPSPSTRRDLTARIPTTAAKVSVAPLGMDPAFVRREEPSTAAVQKAQSLAPYLLCVGNRKPHKNFAAVVEALRELRVRWPRLRMVMVGSAFGRDRALERAADMGLTDAVIALEDVGDDELRALYAHSAAFVFPSLYEGLGLPILEAMACGAPVVTSNVASMPEVVGGAGLLIDPTASGSIATAVDALLADSELRERLVRLGAARFAQFGWDATAAGVADLLYRIGAIPPGGRDGMPLRALDFFPAASADGSAGGAASGVFSP